MNPKLLGFLFSMKNSQTWGVKFEIILKKNVGNLLDKLRKLYINGTVIIFGRPQIIENSSQYLRLRKIVSQKESLGALNKTQKSKSAP